MTGLAYLHGNIAHLPIFSDRHPSLEREAEQIVVDSGVALHISKAPPTDFPAIIDLYAHCWSAAYASQPLGVNQEYHARVLWLAGLSQAHDSSEILLVVKNKHGELLGCTHTRPTAKAGEAELYSHFVLPNAQGLGLGRLLLLGVVRRLIKREYSRLTVGDRATNLPANLFASLEAIHLGQRSFVRDDQTLSEEMYGWNDLPRMLRYGRHIGFTNRLTYDP